MAKQNWKAAGGRKTALRTRPTRWTESSRSRVQYITQLVATSLVLVLVVVLLIGVFQWLNPLPAPKLILLTAGYASEALPPNASAAADARLLQGLTEVFDPSDSDSEPAGRERLRAVIRGIAEHKPNRQFLAPWKPTTSVIYVNTIGVGLPSADVGESAEALEAWLIPSDFQPAADIRSQLVPVTDLLTAVGQCRAEQKLLIFDCQRLPVHPMLALASARFVEAARQELRKLAEQDCAGLYVLFSCSPGEYAWPEHPESTSVFGRRFAQGLSGDADSNADERVTLAELADYLEQQVGGWVAGQCIAQQTPLLVDFDRPADVILAAGGDGHEVVPVPPAAAGTFTRPAVAAQLERACARHFDLARRASPACEWTPAQWTSLQDRLLLAERLYRAGDLAAAGITLQKLDADAAALIETHRSLRQIIAELSPAAGSLLARCCANGWSELPATAPDATAPIVSQVMAGSLSLADADKQLAKLAGAAAQPLPIPAQFLRIVAARSKGLPSVTPDEAVELIAQRQQSEDRFQPRHPLAARWLRAEMSRADASRLEHEDRLLLADWQSLPVGAAGSESAGETAAGDASRMLARACTLREQLLADLPAWIAFLNASQPYLSGWRQPDEPSNDEPDGKPAAIPGMDFPRTAARAVLTLLAGLEQLQRELPVDPATLRDDELSGRLEHITAITGDIELQLDRLRQQLVRYVNIVSQERLAATTGDTWRRIDALLLLPFPMSETDARPADAARLRMQLIARAAAVTTPARLASDLPGDSEGTHQRDIHEFHRRLYLLPFDGLPANEMPVGERDFVAGELHRRLVDLAHGARAVDVAGAYRSDTAFRLLRGGLGEDLTVVSPSIRLLVFGLAESIHGQVERVLRDFYGGAAADEAPYFPRLARDLLAGAERLEHVDEFLARVAPPGTPSTAPGTARSPEAVGGPQSLVLSRNLDWQQRITQAEDLVRATRLTAVPAGVEFRASSTARLKLGLATLAGFPRGIAGVFMESGTPETADPPLVGAAPFRLARPADPGDVANALAAGAYFRGHAFTSQVPIRVVSEAGAPAVTYLRQNSGPGRIRTRGDRVDHERLNLLFVLDCSGSMSLPDELGEARMSSLRSVLTEFAGSVTDPEVRVGFRLLGHREADVTAPAAHTDTELIQPIGPFGPAPLERVLSRLRPVGHSPIFNALIAARQDFEGITEGRREIVLISDGADNWALAGQKPGLDELLAEYRGSGIRISTIGYNVDRAADYLQLQSIATAGEFEGRSVSVTNAKDLLWELAGLAGLPGCRVLSAGRVVFEQRQLALNSQPLELSAGQYDVEVLGAGGETLARAPVRLLPAEEHVLAFEAGALRYADDPRAAARAVAVGDERQPDLLVLDAQAVDGALALDFGLLGKPDGPVDLIPASAQIVAVTPAGRGPTWRFRQLTPNVAGRRFPAWQVELSDWPTEATSLELHVSWNDLPDRSVPVTLDWNTQFSERPVVDNVVLTRRERESVEIDGASRTAVLLTFVLSEKGPGIERWGLNVPGPVLQARHAYDADLGIYAARIVVSDDAPLNQVFLVHAPSARADRTLAVTVPLGDIRINR
jgi:Mg-chelatase subunit ChlD